MTTNLSSGDHCGWLLSIIIEARMLNGSQLAQLSQGGNQTSNLLIANTTLSLMNYLWIEVEWVTSSNSTRCHPSGVIYSYPLVKSSDITIYLYKPQERLITWLYHKAQHLTDPSKCPSLTIKEQGYTCDLIKTLKRTYLSCPWCLLAYRLSNHTVPSLFKL